MNLTGEQWGVMNETGSYPGQPWLWLYTLWYQVPGFIHLGERRHDRRLHDRPGHAPAAGRALHSGPARHPAADPGTPADLAQVGRRRPGHGTPPRPGSPARSAPPPPTRPRGEGPGEPAAGPLTLSSSGHTRGGVHRVLGRRPIGEKRVHAGGGLCGSHRSSEGGLPFSQLSPLPRCAAQGPTAWQEGPKAAGGYRAHQPGWL